MRSKIVAADALTKVYKKQVKAVDNVSFSVEEGELFGLLGPNGAGKTTTIKMLTTLASITSGKASVAGYDVSKNPSDVRRVIGVVPQELTVDDELTGVENLLLSAKLHHVPDEKIRSKIRDLLKLLELEGAMQRKVKTYSGGMRRRLQLAMGLVHQPKILFLDEPTLGLDIQTRHNMWMHLRRLNRENGITVFLTTHYLEEADELCDRILIIDEGTIKASGSPSELKDKLGGALLRLRLVGDADASNALREITDVTEVTKENQTYIVKVSRVETALPAIVEAVTALGLKICEVNFSKSTLDQVFLQITGAAMRDKGVNMDFGQRMLLERLK